MWNKNSIKARTSHFIYLYAQENQELYLSTISWFNGLRIEWNLVRIVSFTDFIEHSVPLKGFSEIISVRKAKPLTRDSSWSIFAI
jgi:hypothetical protein